MYLGDGSVVVDIVHLEENFRDVSQRAARLSVQCHTVSYNVVRTAAVMPTVEPQYHLIITSDSVEKSFTLELNFTCYKLKKITMTKITMTMTLSLSS